MNTKDIQGLIINTILFHRERKHCPTSYMIRDTMGCTGGKNRKNACESVAENGICIYCSRIVNMVR